MRIAVYWRTAGVALALRPLNCVLSGAELALLLLLALLLDEWAAHARSRDAEAEAGEKPHEQKTPRRIASAATREDVEAALQEMTSKRRTDVIGAAVADDMSACCYERAGSESGDSCSTSDTALLSASPCSRHDEREWLSDFDDCAFFTSSMALSRFSEEIVHNVAFTHKRGELEMRRDSVLGVFKPWRKCSVLLSVASGELFVHRKSRSPPQVFPLSRFTGASIRSTGRHTFTVIFDGHAPLCFRAAKMEDAESWVAALEYAKETTWRMWS